jgi:alcohol dehydrogenase class IV
MGWSLSDMETLADLLQQEDERLDIENVSAIPTTSSSLSQASNLTVGQEDESTERLGV